jgi:hypothetical protein
MILPAVAEHHFARRGIALCARDAPSRGEHSPAAAPRTREFATHTPCTSPPQLPLEWETFIRYWETSIRWEPCDGRLLAMEPAHMAEGWGQGCSEGDCGPYHRASARSDQALHHHLSTWQPRTLTRSNCCLGVRAPPSSRTVLWPKAWLLKLASSEQPSMAGDGGPVHCCITPHPQHTKGGPMLEPPSHAPRRSNSSMTQCRTHLVMGAREEQRPGDALTISATPVGPLTHSPHTHTKATSVPRRSTPCPMSSSHALMPPNALGGPTPQQWRRANARPSPSSRPLSLYPQ